MTTQQRIPYRARQRGMASILITMVMMVVISLIVLGFATVSRREQGQASDRQLSTQAFYAAESGIEDARKAMANKLAAGQIVPAKNSCAADANYPANSLLSSTYNVSYSCLTVDPAPNSLQYSGIADGSTSLPVHSTANISRITISWSPATLPNSGTPSADCPAAASSAANGTFAPASGSGAWRCGYGVLRTDLTPTDGALTRAGLQSGTLSSTLEPVRVPATGSVNYATSVGQALVTPANCTLGSYGTCSVTYTMPGNKKQYALRLRSLYQTSNIKITAFNGASQLLLYDAQAVVDVTGKANDVLRRIQVRLPIGASVGNIPDYAVQSNGSLCKRYYVTPSYYKNAGDVVEPDPANAMCDNSRPPSGSL